MAEMDSWRAAHSRAAAESACDCPLWTCQHSGVETCPFRTGGGRRLRYSVADQGIGIPLAERERIFEKFYRLDPNLTRGVGGTGLGLYICRELISRMGGAIRVESTEGAGSTFTVELPAAEEAAAAALGK